MRRIALIFVVCTMLISSCLGTQYDRSAIQQKKEYIIVLEKQKPGQDMVYAHPVHMDVPKMKEMLKTLSYVRKEGVFNMEDSGPVFQQKEIDRLAAPLVSALAQSDGSEHVRFVSLNTKKKLMLMTTYQKTEGILFKDAQSRINFAFSHINSQVSSDDPISLQAEFSEKNPMSIKSSDAKLTSRSPLFQHYTTDSGQVFPMWMTASLEKVDRIEAISPKTVNPVQNQFPEEKVTEIEVQKEVKEKLIYLKELLDEGLITDEDYAARKKLLLDKLE